MHDWSGPKRKKAIFLSKLKKTLYEVLMIKAFINYQKL
jgi:hypothetical protein